MITLVVVNYRSASLAAEAIRSARAASKEELQVVVVDNSCDPREAEQLRPHAGLLLTPPANLGYAGAINAARSHCHSDVFVVSNPDVIYSPGSLDVLVDAVRRQHFAVAGPAIYWDDAQRWILPPSEIPTLAGRVGEALATRSRTWHRRRDRRRLRRRLAFWGLRDTTAVEAVSGAVMAIDARAFDAAGGFDERFALYFEETDFQRRVVRGGGRVAYVPDARCRHVYNQSAGREEVRAAAAYSESEAAYFSRWYGTWAMRLVRLLEATPSRRAFERCPERWELPRPGLVVEASPLPSFLTAAGHFPPAGVVRVPDEVWTTYRAEALYLRAIDPATAEVVATCVRYRS